MRKPKNSLELFHYWAHQILPSARCGNVSYDGPSLYSYSARIALLVPGGVVHSQHKWSITTSGHQTAARASTRHLQHVYAPYVDSMLPLMHSHNKELWLVQLSAALDELKKHPRRKASIGVRITDLMHERDAYRNFFQLSWEDADLGAMQAEIEAAQRAHQEAELKRAEEAETRRQQRVAQEQIDLLTWRNGGTPASYRFETTALRIKDDEIETTHGARIPIEHAKATWPLLCRYKRDGKIYERNEHTIHLGHYALDGFDGETLKVGCHEIPWVELVAIAHQLGLNSYELSQETEYEHAPTA